MVNVESQVEPMPVSAELVQRAAQETLVWKGASGDLTIALGDDVQLRALNREFLGIDAATDVLSFPSKETDPDSGEPYLGDVIISVARAQAQAQVAGHTLDAEMQLLVVHGVLHLLGHDHAMPADKKGMWFAQDEVLKRLGLGGIEVRE